MTRGLRLFVSVVVVGLALDLWSKDAAFEAVPTARDRVEIVKDVFYLAHVRNSGMAWSLLQNVEREAWIVVRGLLSLALLWLYRGATKSGAAPWWAHFGFAAVLAGALGNLYDNVFALDGHVRDFILVYIGSWPFPVFNVADALITIGAPVLFVFHWKLDRAEAARAKASEAASAATRIAAVAAAEETPESPAERATPSDR